tara:strand:- start:511 stop:804 length:294 start_codon:yes stop_codon:yes gene_type:complete
MITREEYNKALDIVEAYHKQLFIDSVSGSLRDLGKTHLKDWKDYPKCSRRLKNVLHDAFYGDWKFAENIEDISIRELRRCRGAGKKTLDEFKELRGY